MKSNHLLLHRAIKQDASFEQINAILSQHPSCIDEIDNYRRTPLFLSVQRKQSFEIVQLILQANTRLASKQNYMGEIPLHVTRCTEIAKLLLDIYPEGIYVKTISKRIPLHTALTHQLAHLLLERERDMNIIKHGVMSPMLTLFRRDREGLIPLEKVAISVEFLLRCSGGSSSNCSKSGSSSVCCINKDDSQSANINDELIPKISTQSNNICTCTSFSLNNVTSILWSKLCLLAKAMMIHYYSNSYYNCSNTRGETYDSTVTSIIMTPKQKALPTNTFEQISVKNTSNNNNRKKGYDEPYEKDLLLHDFQMVHAWIALRNIEAVLIGDYTNDIGAKFSRTKGTKLNKNGKNNNNWFFYERILETAMDLYPNQIYQKDSLSRTPLVIAIYLIIGSSSFALSEKEDTLTSPSTTSQNDNHGESDAGNENEQEEGEEEEGEETIISPYDIVNNLLKRSHIPVSMTDQNGRLPLHIISESSTYSVYGKGGMIDIVMAGPKSLEVTDPITGLYPFALAAAKGSICGKKGIIRKNEKHSCDVHDQCLDKIFFLLKESPQLLG